MKFRPFAANTTRGFLVCLVKQLHDDGTIRWTRRGLYKHLTGQRGDQLRDELGRESISNISFNTLTNFISQAHRAGVLDSRTLPRVGSGGLFREYRLSAPAATAKQMYNRIFTSIRDQKADGPVVVSRRRNGKPKAQGVGIVPPVKVTGNDPKSLDAHIQRLKEKFPGTTFEPLEDNGHGGDYQYELPLEFKEDDPKVTVTVAVTCPSGNRYTVDRKDAAALAKALTAPI
tara:strand:- start:310 stop:999 length:690 start_codon:yes stop_codon:yes gene_type:complete